MLKPSSAFIDALRFGSTIVASRITMYQGGHPTAVVLPVSTADFTVDRNSAQRRQGQITLEVVPTIPPETVTVNNVASPLLPLSPAALLAPFGNEIYVEMTVGTPGGVAGANGWVPLGMYAITTTTVQDGGSELVMTLDLQDRSWAIAQRQLLTAYNVPAAGGGLQAEITALLNLAWGSTPPWTYAFDATTYVVPAGTYQQGQDPWQACIDMATSAGFELFFDVNGNVRCQKIPDPSTSPVVWNFAEGAVSAIGNLAFPIGGTAYTTPTSVSTVMTRDGIPNAFYVTASGSNNASGGNTPVQAVAADTNPQSPTFVGGPMGTVPSFVSDSLITTQAQALAEGELGLAQSLAKAWKISVATPPNPLFDIDDVVTVDRPRVGLNGTKLVIDTITTSVRYAVVTTVSGRVVP